MGKSKAKIRKEKERLRKRAERAAETKEQRDVRLGGQRNRTAAARDAGTEEQ